MDEVELKTIRQEMVKIRIMLTDVVQYMREAETEVSEKMRRFIMYMHDVHDIINLYHERGIDCPDYIMREMERCDDRFRQLLQEANTDGGTFEKVRREMAKDAENKWDHTRAISGPRKDVA